MQHYLNFQFGSFLRKTYDRMFQSLKKLTVGTFQTTSHGDHKIFKGFSRSSKKHSKNYFFEYQQCRQKGKIISKRFDQSFCLTDAKLSRGKTWATVERTAPIQLMLITPYFLNSIRSSPLGKQLAHTYFSVDFWKYISRYFQGLDSSSSD